MKKLFSIFLVLLMTAFAGSAVFADALPENYSLVYRLYNPQTGEHLYTGDANEYNTLVDTKVWEGEGGVFLQHNDPSETPVFRLRHPKSPEHLYTIDDNEVTTLVRDQGWILDNNGRPVFTSSNPPQNGQFDWLRDGNYVSRLYNTKTGLHLLTNDSNEIETLINSGDWKYDYFEGSDYMFYAIYPYSFYLI